MIKGAFQNRKIWETYPSGTPEVRNINDSLPLGGTGYQQRGGINPIMVSLWPWSGSCHLSLFSLKYPVLAKISDFYVASLGLECAFFSLNWFSNGSLLTPPAVIWSYWTCICGILFQNRKNNDSEKIVPVRIVNVFPLILFPFISWSQIHRVIILLQMTR